MNRFATGRRPGRIHQRRLPDTRGERKSPGERLPKANQVWHHPGLLARKPAPSATETRVNLIDDQERAFGIGDSSQQREKPGWRHANSAPPLDWLNENGPEITDVEMLFEQF